MRDPSEAGLLMVEGHFSILRSGRGLAVRKPRPASAWR